MSMDVYAAHLYGIGLYGNWPELCPKFDGISEVHSEPDIFDVAKLVNDGLITELPEGYPKNAEDVEFIYGPNATLYIGYSATMPYEVPKFTKEQMDKNIKDLLVYLFGRKGKNFVFDMIFDTWIE